MSPRTSRFPSPRCSRGRRSAALVATVLLLTGAAQAQSRLLTWGANNSGQCDVPALPVGVRYVQVAAGSEHSIGLRSDGSIVAWGYCGAGQCAAPALPPGVVYVEVAAENDFSLARRSDGWIVAFGSNEYGQCRPPDPPPGLGYVGMAAGWEHALGLLGDGSLVAWGRNDYGQCDVPDLPPGLSYVEVDAGARHSVARRSDGSVIVWGLDAYGVGNVPPLPAPLTYVEITSGVQHVVARRSDGSALAWGYDSHGQAQVPALPAGLSYVEVAASWVHSMARRSDGSVVVWGDLEAAPPLPGDMGYAGIATGNSHALAFFHPLPACGSVALQCWPPQANSASPAGAHLVVLGCPGILANELELSVTGLPPGQVGLFLYGPESAHLPLGDGLLCVGAGAQRILPPQVSSLAGTAQLALDLTQGPFSSGPNAVTAGSAWSFQYWYRDRGGDPATVNLSDAAHVVFAD